MRGFPRKFYASKISSYTVSHICQSYFWPLQVYPEYYIVIKQPIDLREIREKIKNGRYTSVDAMMADMELLVSNACTFNEEDSVVYTVSHRGTHTHWEYGLRTRTTFGILLQDALMLRKTARNAVEQIQQKWPEMFPSAHVTKSKRLSTSGASIMSPGLKTEVEVPSDILELFTAVKEYKVSARGW